MNDNVQNNSEHGNYHDRTISLWINGEKYETSSHKLTVRQILEIGGFTPPEQYRLIRENGDKIFTDMNQELPIHEDERFTATYGGRTEVS